MPASRLLRSLAAASATVSLLAAFPAAGQNHHPGPGPNPGGNHGRDAPVHRAPEFDPAVAGVIAVIVAGGGALLVRRRRG